MQFLLMDSNSNNVNAIITSTTATKEQIQNILTE